MPRPVSVDLRRRAVRAYKAGEGSFRTLAKRFQVGEKSIRRWVQLEKETGSLSPSSAPRGPRPKIDEEGREALRALLAERCDLTNIELADELAALGIETSASGVSRALLKMGWSRKKNASGSGTR